MIAHNEGQKKSWIQGLIIECPMGQSLPKCPLAEIRFLPLKDRLLTIKEMTEEEIDNALAYHRHCLHVREKM
ncbi:MAG: hypothetical protein ACYTFY_08955 [Planctomycetota bacterium]|jgi:hypothetical protein